MIKEKFVYIAHMRESTTLVCRGILQYIETPVIRSRYIEALLDGLFLSVAEKKLWVIV